MSDGRRVTNRPLRWEEVALLRWLVAHGTEEAPRYAGQVDRMRVVFALPPSAPGPKAKHQPERRSGTERA
jgi:hypothetical protein